MVKSNRSRCKFAWGAHLIRVNRKPQKQKANRKYWTINRLLLLTVTNVFSFSVRVLVFNRISIGILNCRQSSCTACIAFWWFISFDINFGKLINLCIPTNDAVVVCSTYYFHSNGNWQLEKDGINIKQESLIDNLTYKNVWYYRLRLLFVDNNIHLITFIWMENR